MTFKITKLSLCLLTLISLKANASFEEASELYLAVTRRKACRFQAAAASGDADAVFLGFFYLKGKTSRIKRLQPSRYVAGKGI